MLASGTPEKPHDQAWGGLGSKVDTGTLTVGWAGCGTPGEASRGSWKWPWLCNLSV